jgi:DNA-binding response OmpR family regulator
MATLLIAEDDGNMRELIRRRLGGRHAVLEAADGLSAFEIISTRHVDLLISDVMMPRMDGFALVQKLRREGFELPVLMLTAKQSFDAKREGFRSGTDDYMTKPFNYDELLWRVQALLRRAAVPEDRSLTAGGIVLDGASYAVARGDERVELSRKEFELLFRLLSSPGRIFTKDQLLADIWGSDSESGEDTVKTHVYRLRNKIAGFAEIGIVAVKGIGYKAEIREGGK